MNSGYEIISAILIVVLIGCIWWLNHALDKKKELQIIVNSLKSNYALSTSDSDDENLRQAAMFGILDHGNNLYKSLIYMSAINNREKRDLARLPIVEKLMCNNYEEEASIVISQITTPQVIDSVNEMLAERHETTGA